MNRPRSFQSTVTIESGISNFHKMVITVLKTETKNHSMQELLEP